MDWSLVYRIMTGSDRRTIGCCCMEMQTELDESQ